MIVYTLFLFGLALIGIVFAEDSLNGYAFSCGVRSNFVQTGPYYAFSSNNKVFCAGNSQVYECGSYSYDKNSELLSTIINDGVNFSGNQVLAKNILTFEGVVLSFTFDLGYQVNPCIVQALDWRQIESGRTDVFFKCPTMNWIQGASYEKIEFSFYNTGYFWQTVWLEITYGTGDTIRSDFHGVYAYDPSNGYIHLYSAAQDGKDARVLRGTLTNDGALVIDGYTQVDNQPCQAESGDITNIPSSKTYPVPLTLKISPSSTANRSSLNRVISLAVIMSGWYVTH